VTSSMVMVDGSLVSSLDAVFLEFIFANVDVNESMQVGLTVVYDYDDV
jgi:hypothetical protein